MMHSKHMTFYASALIGVNVVGFWELYLQFRQWKSYFRERLPTEISDIVKEEDFRSSQAYGKDRGAFAICMHVKDIFISNVSILTKTMSRLYGWTARSLPVTVGSFAHSYAYSVVSDVVLTLVDLPFDYYYDFVIEEKHGFNKMTRNEFAKDKLKMLLLRVTLLHPISTGLILKVVRHFGEDFPLYFFLASTGLLTSFTFIFPTLIQPLFNTYTPVSEDTTLHKNIVALAKRNEFPMSKLYQVDGSRRSGHSNAYFYGFWRNKRIVLYDTIIKQMEEDDDLILSLLCHELGHWKYNHTTLSFGISIVLLLCISFGAKQVIFNRGVYKQFGFSDVNPYIGFGIFLQVAVDPLMRFLGYTMSLLSRRFEFQADRFAVESGYGLALRRALLTAQRENKMDLTPDHLFAALKYSHPPLLERIAAIDAQLRKHE